MGIDDFRGHKMHSHDYRRPEQFQDETILIIGSGPSGRDILYEIAPKAKRVIFSHHRNLNGHNLPSNVTQVTDVKCFKENSVQFEDDAEEQISCVLFCTGNRFHRNFTFNSNFKFNKYHHRIYIFISISIGGLWPIIERHVSGAAFVQAFNQHQSADNGHRWITNMRLFLYVRLAGRSDLETFFFFSS